MSGLSGTLELRNNGTEALAVTADGSYKFNTSLKTNDPYHITIATQPSGQRCEISGASGTVASQNITGVNISCQAAYTIGGTVSGLSSGQLQLQNNGGDTLTIDADGDFQFDTPLVAGEGYSVTVTTQPDKQSCAISVATNTVTNANIDNIAIQCNVIPTGYYSGSASLKSTADATDGSSDVPVGDLQGMINGNRMMLMSVTTKLLYDGTITVSGNTYSGTLNVYKSGRPITVNNGSGPEAMTVPVSGTLVGGLSIEGAFAAQGAGNGTFKLTYAPSNNELASFERITTTYNYNDNKGTWWGGIVYGWGPAGGFTILADIEPPYSPFQPVGSGSTGLVNNCAYYIGSSLTPQAGTALYEAVIEFVECNNVVHQLPTNGFYSGLAMLVADDRLLLAFTREQDGLGLFAEYTIQTY